MESVAVLSVKGRSVHVITGDIEKSIINKGVKYLGIDQQCPINRIHQQPKYAAFHRKFDSNRSSSHVDVSFWPNPQLSAERATKELGVSEFLGGDMWPFKQDLQPREPNCSQPT